MKSLLNFFIAVWVTCCFPSAWAGHMFTQGSANIPTWISQGTGIAVNQIGLTNSGNGLESSQNIFQIYLEAPTVVPSAANTTNSNWWQWSAGDVMSLSISTTAGPKTYTLAYDASVGCTSSACGVSNGALSYVAGTTALVTEVRGLSLTLPTTALSSSNMFTWTISALAGEFALGGFRIGFANGTLDGSSTGPLNQSSVVSVNNLPSGGQTNTSVPDIVSSGNGVVNLVSTIASGASPNYNNRFDGGVLKVDATGSYTNNFTVTSNGATLDQAGLVSTFSGIISNDSTDTSTALRNLTITNSGSNGSLTLTGVNTFTGRTTVDAGAKLDLSGPGSISTSSEVVANGIFDITSTNSGASIKSLSGAGSVVTASGKSLDLTAASGNFSGAISGAGGVVISAGSETFSGTNTYTGSTSINTGTTLSVSGSGSLAASSGVVANGTFDISTATNGVSIKTLSGSGSVLTDGGKMLTLTNAADTFSGVISGSGGVRVTSGIQTLSGVNTHTGVTQVDAGAMLSISAGSSLGLGTVALVGSPTISATLQTTANTTISNAITVAGDPTFDVATGTTTTVTGVISDGTVAGDVVVIGGGTLVLTSANSYSGPTTISVGTLKLSGLGAIASSTVVTNTGTLDVAGATGNVTFAGTYAQSAAAVLKMTVAPVDNQKVNVAGAANINGTLDLAASAGTYRAGRYTLMTSTGLGGTSFSGFNTNLASVTDHTYNLAYDANDVYLELRSSAADTLLSIAAMGLDLNKVLNAQAGIAQLGLSYDCKLFDEKNLCFSTGARSTHSQGDGSTYESVALIAAYSVKPDLRVGAWIDQNKTRKSSMNVTEGNSTPMLGAFAVWSDNPITNEGMGVKFAAAYGQKDLTLNRPVFGTSELGQGNSKLTTLMAEATIDYGIKLNERTNLAPFVGLRYSKLSNTAFTENADIFSPLTFAKATQSGKSVTAGLNLSDLTEGPIGLDLSAGVEHFSSMNPAQLNASGIAGLTTVQVTPTSNKNRPFASASLHFDIAKKQQLLFGLSHSKHFSNTDWVTSATVRYVIGL